MSKTPLKRSDGYRAVILAGPFHADTFPKGGIVIFEAETPTVLEFLDQRVSLFTGEQLVLIWQESTELPTTATRQGKSTSRTGPQGHQNPSAGTS